MYMYDTNSNVLEEIMCGKEVDIDFSTLLFYWEFVYIVDSVCVLTHCVCL